MDWTEIFRADPALEVFEASTHGRVRLALRRGYTGAADLLGVFGEGSRPVSFAGGGREAHPVIELPGGERVLVRRYKRGGLLRKVNRERYFRGHRAFDELRVTEHAARNGVRVPMVIGAWERKSIIGYTAALATRWIPNAPVLDAWLRSAPPADRRFVLGATGLEIARMHDAGIGHPDLNLRNVLVAPADGRPLPDVYLIDFDRARLYPSHVTFERRRRDLLRFRRSARKLQIRLAPDEWVIFRDGYGERWPLAEPRG